MIAAIPNHVQNVIDEALLVGATDSFRKKILNENNLLVDIDLWFEGANRIHHATEYNVFLNGNNQHQTDYSKSLRHWEDIQLN